MLAVCMGHIMALAGRAALAEPGVEVNGTSIYATHGIHQLEVAVPLSVGSWVVSTDGEFFTADNLAIAGEHHRRLKWRGAFAFSPWRGLDLGLSWTAMSNSSRPVLSSPTVNTGDPELSAKFAHVLDSKLALGALLQILVPTSEDGSGLAFNGTTVTGQALATYQPARALTLTLDAGYRFDNTRKVFSSSFAAGEETLMRFDGNIARTNALVGGLGAIGDFEASGRVTAAPFVEFVAAVAPSGSFSENHIAANLGAKALIKAEGLVELSAGATLRIAGAPSATSKLPGLPPWEAFVRLAFHPASATKADPAGIGPDHCDDQNACGDRFACVKNACLPVQEVIKEVTKVPPTFLISGVITDGSTGAPIREAAVRISGSENTLLTDGNGAFSSWPIAVDDGLVQISAIAPGFRPAQQNLTKGPAGETKTVAIQLVRLGKKVNGTIRGSLRDKGTGMPVVGVISIPSAGKTVYSNGEGNFAVELPSGRHELLITAPDMKPQEKQITVGPGEVVILNVDMTPQRK
jgi:hypothetical protein